MSQKISCLEAGRSQENHHGVRGWSETNLELEPLQLVLLLQTRGTGESLRGRVPSSTDADPEESWPVWLRESFSPSRTRRSTPLGWSNTSFLSHLRHLFPIDDIFTTRYDLNETNYRSRTRSSCDTFSSSIAQCSRFLYAGLSISFRALSSSHPRRAFHRRIPGQLVKRCIRPSNGYPGGGNSTSITGSSTTRSSTSTRTSTSGSTSPTTTRASTTSAPSSSPSSSSSPTSTSTSTSTATSSATTPSSTWRLQQRMEGSNFFDQWDFWSASDPTNGAVDYQSRENAQNAGLIEITSEGHAIMRIENTTQVTGNRRSVRISSKYIMNGGLAILDAVHMPHGCGTWPAWWTTDVPNWPHNGEIDIVEGVNGYVRNQASLHTAVGCTISNDYGSTGTLAASTNCAAEETGNMGCGQLSTQSNSLRQTFQRQWGGVYALLWQSTGVSVYFFPRNAIPSDITSEAPQPSTWGTPSGNWPSTPVTPQRSWTAAGAGGQTESCSASTGVSNCLDYIRNNGAAFTDAYWEVKSVKVYTT
ncbi:glycoside hydrolase family 16 protein [Rhizoctonia solani]|uniref:Glycoside hydrolase family 16 protein n=1 Tax=Rhizoctonia solani TaxID=456999 RepID=A0A8H7IKK8_9AGAM|nr:glycoside hydrolase family 16 protein [Rhizoctonia solani]